MTKRQMIDKIVSMNQTAEPGFLSRFEEQELNEYLNHLQTARTPRLMGEPGRFDQYFENCPAIAFVPPVELAFGSPEEDDVQPLQAPAEEPALPEADEPTETNQTEADIEPVEFDMETYADETPDYDAEEAEPAEPELVAAAVSDEPSFAETDVEAETWLF